MHENKSFTLIELVIVMLILGILALVIMPKMYQIQTKAQEKSDMGVIGALKSAIDAKHMDNIINQKNVWPGNPGGDPFEKTDHPTCGNPFTLLNPSPTSMHYSMYGSPISKNKWLYTLDATGTQYYSIYCPHFGYTNGIRYVYNFTDTTITLPSNKACRPGEIIVDWNYQHH